MKYTKHRKNLVSFRYLYFALGLCAILIAVLANSPVPTRAALNPATPSYEGILDRADCNQISGWARDKNNPNQSIDVYILRALEIVDLSDLLAILPANRFRQDLLDGGMQNPYHGFLMFTPSDMKNGQIHTIAAKFPGTNIDLDDSPRFIACNASLFQSTPQTTAPGLGDTWEQGVEFSSSMSGIIRKVRFWRADGEPQGGHTARIWSNSGTLLKSKTFSETSTPGWQYATVDFPITAGVRYRVSYNINYVVAKTFNTFQNGPITKGPLTAWGSWYTKGAGNFPTTGSTSNLFADIVFNAPR